MLSKDNNNAERDEEYEAQAAEARRRGTELIENHLSHHMDQNPDSSYVTWVACLHPENAEVTIDERFLVPGNPWWTVYEGAKGEIPTATATPAGNEATSNTLVAGQNTTNGTNNTSEPETDLERQSSGLDLVVGCFLSVATILAVFGMEAAAFTIYMISAGFYRVAQALDPPSVATGIFYSICLLVYYSLALVDSCLLIASVLTTEIMAGALFILSCLFAGSDMAARWHQYLRRTSHLLRWAFRSKSLSSYPPRHLCCVCLSKEEMEEVDEGAGVATDEERRSDNNADWWAASATSTAATPVTPSAPPSPEPVIVVIDESNIIVDPDNHDANDGSGKSN